MVGRACCRSSPTTLASMPIVLVHGVPETETLWDDFRGNLRGREVITLSAPGFGAPAADSFAGTSDDYVAWLVDQLQRIDGPIDVLGHDWGGGHVFRAVAARLLSSFVGDGHRWLLRPSYVWHEIAQTWQTPGAGEALIEQRKSIPATDVVQGYMSRGMSEGAAASCAAARSDAMGRCILALYRSAAQPRMAEWGADVAGLRTREGLIIIPTGDVYTAARPSLDAQPSVPVPRSVCCQASGTGGCARTHGVGLRPS